MTILFERENGSCKRTSAELRVNFATVNIISFHNDVPWNFEGQFDGCLTNVSLSVIPSLIGQLKANVLISLSYIKFMFNYIKEFSYYIAFQVYKLFHDEFRNCYF